MKRRNEVYDLMKGIAIFLIMLCHLVYYEDDIVNRFVCSFHVPLFFILSGFFSKDIFKISEFIQYTKNNFRRLILPYIVTMLILCVWGAFRAVLKNDMSFIMVPFLSMISASADCWYTKWGLAFPGPLWFIVALFLIKEFFGVLQYTLRNINIKYRDASLFAISILLSVFYVFVRPKINFPLPFCLGQAITAMSFYAVGWFFKRHSLPIWICVLCIICWPLSIMYGKIILAACIIEYYPLSFMGACGGTLIVYYVCKKIHEYFSDIIVVKSIRQMISWCGLYSLPILCMHHLEMYSSIIYSLQCRIPQIQYLIGWGEIFIAILLAAVVIKIPGLKNVYI